MTPEQRKLARYALGLPNSGRRSYRKHFVTGQGSPDWPHWNAMVSAGYAKVKRNIAVYGGHDGFVLTYAGATAALELGESLCLEDFPATGA